MGHLQNIQSFETAIETGNLEGYDEQSIHKIFIFGMTYTASECIPTVATMYGCKFL